jgi:hypothetical protein
MPRQSQAALSLAHIRPRRLEPPAEFGEGLIEREIFRQVVASVPLDQTGAGVPSEV